MSYRNKELCRVRTITTFLSLSEEKETWKDAIFRASRFCAYLTEELKRNDYLVQSVRIVTNPFGEYLNTSSLDGAKADLDYLSQLLRTAASSGVRLRFAIGEAKTQKEVELLPDLIREFGDLCNACVNVKRDEHGILDNELIRSSSKAILKISELTSRGRGILILQSISIASRLYPISRQVIIRRNWGTALS